MQINKLEWDSEFFGFTVGDVFLENDFSDSTVLHSDFPFIQIRSKMPFDIVSDTHSLSYTETKIIFSKVLKEPNSAQVSVDFDDFPVTEKSLYDLAYESGKYSRYKQDRNFSEAKFKELYETWIKNSINKTFADKLFYIREKEDVLGFVTVKVKNDVAQIGLIAVAPIAQGKGLGKKLLMRTENYCLQNNIKTLNIPTQLENKPACQFYTKMGYTISEQIIIKHYWRNNF